MDELTSYAIAKIDASKAARDFHIASKKRKNVDAQDVLESELTSYPLEAADITSMMQGYKKNKLNLMNATKALRSAAERVAPAYSQCDDEFPKKVKYQDTDRCGLQCKLGHFTFHTKP